MGINDIEHDAEEICKNVINVPEKLACVENKQKEKMEKWYRLQDELQDSSNLLLNIIPATGKDDKKVFLYIGIIDILQKYNWKKRIERLGKMIVYNRKKISVAGSEFYAKRFREYIENSVFGSVETQKKGGLATLPTDLQHQDLEHKDDTSVKEN
uniref:PIPK domain-containing protein n=1 Tax=Ditylenchus dipsaci TaxID=166011 RepID=A0A915CV07_9BILA